VTTMLTIASVTALAASFAAGPVADRFGRKGLMVLGLAVNGLVYLFFDKTKAWASYALLISLMRSSRVLHTVGGNTMVADIIPIEERSEAYSLLRMAENVGIAIGPAIGGFLTAISYSIAFCAAAVGLGIFTLLVAFFTIETLPRQVRKTSLGKGQDGGYRQVLKDRRFVAFCAMVILQTMAAALVFLLLPVYAKENFGVPESRSGFFLVTNAILVVTLQFTVTRLSKRYSPMLLMVIGTLFYAAGVGSVGLGGGFLSFLLSMMVMTVGELICAPTATALAANMAPPESRGRYMGVFGLAWAVAFGFGPVIGGVLNDQVAPVAIWYGGALMALVGAAGFAVLARKR